MLMAKKTTKKMSDQEMAIKKVKAELAKAKTKVIAAERKVVAYAKKNPKKAAAIGVAVAAAIGLAAYKILKKK